MCEINNNPPYPSVFPKVPEFGDTALQLKKDIPRIAKWPANAANSVLQTLVYNIESVFILVPPTLLLGASLYQNEVPGIVLLSGASFITCVALGAMYKW